MAEHSHLLKDLPYQLYPKPTQSLTQHELLRRSRTRRCGLVRFGRTSPSGHPAAATLRGHPLQLWALSFASVHFYRARRQ
jgi:hypothetical protein